MYIKKASDILLKYKHDLHWRRIGKAIVYYRKNLLLIIILLVYKTYYIINYILLYLLHYYLLLYIIYYYYLYIYYINYIFIATPFIISRLVTTNSCRRKLNLRPKTRQVLRCLLIMIIVCIAMNMTTLVSIGYHISVRQETLIDVFNASMHLYATAESYKYAIDEIQFVLQCCGHSSYTDWFLFDWQVYLSISVSIASKQPKNFASLNE